MQYEYLEGISYFDGFTIGTFDPHWQILFGFYIFVLIILYFSTKKQRIHWLDERFIVYAIFAVYGVFLAYFVFTPIKIWNADYRAFYIAHYLNREPFTLLEIMSIDLLPIRSIIHTINGTPRELWMFVVRGIGGNFILLFPLPFFLALLSKKRIPYLKMLLYAALVSIFIEVTQLFINLLTGWPNRLVLIDDVILNTAGALVGYFVFLKTEKFWRWLIHRIYMFIIGNKVIE